MGEYTHFLTANGWHAACYSVGVQVEHKNMKIKSNMDLEQYARYVRDRQPHDASMAGASDQTDGGAVLGALCEGNESLAWSFAQDAGWDIEKE